MIPAIAIGLIVAAGGIALVLDQLWLSSAGSEIQTAANAAALAAAQELVDEEQLKYEFDPEQWAQNVREVAASVAARNSVVGRPAYVSVKSNEDVRLGKPVLDELTGHHTFIETDYYPTSVMITAHRDRATGNPISLFMPYLTGQSHGDVVGFAEASVSNHIRAVRPLDHANVPAWPIAILESNGGDLDDWMTAIEAYEGKDEFGWDHSKKVVIDEPDGLPEMTLKSGNDELAGNVKIVDLGSGLFDTILQTQFEDGLHWEHLQEFGSELGFESGPLSLKASHDFSGVPDLQLSQQIGQTRIILLYESQTESVNGTHQEILATRLVAIRLLAVHENIDGFEFIVQPAVITTRTAVLSDSDDLTDTNQYIYKIALTQ